MKLLHTSDWHLGHRLLEQSQQEEQQLFLNWLLDYINANAIDVLLISGDIFDVGVPSTQAQKMYYDFLIHLHQSVCRKVIITGGNHDAPGTLNAPRELLDTLGIHVVGKATGNPEEEVFRIKYGKEDLLIAAVPYLRDQDIRRAVSGETADEINNRYKNALIKHFEELMDHCNTLRNPDTKVIAMGHLFAIGGRTSESEQSIYVGNLGDIGADDFPQGFDYIALGHLHRAQSVGGKAHIRYSGSPCILSFSEVNQEKKVVLIETGATLNIEEVTIPAFRPIVQIEGTVESCKAQLQKLSAHEASLTPWVEVILTDESEATTGYKEISDFAATLEPRVLKITVKDDYKYDKLKSLVENGKHIRAFTPTEVFRMKCEEMHINPDTETELMDAFQELLQQLTEKEDSL